VPLPAQQLKLALAAPLMNPFFYSEEAGAKGLPLSLHPKSPLNPSLRSAPDVLS
jgi:hypothetical protein